MKRFISSFQSAPIVLSAACSATFVLWLLQSRQLIISDAANYALLSESIWTTGTYSLHGEAYAKHLPLHPLLSYPLMRAFGMSIGLKVSSFLAGCAVLCLTYFLVRKQWNASIAALTVFLTAIHHNFVFMMANGYADMLFAALFLGFAYCFLEAEDNKNFYLPAGLLIGLSCLTRYNGAPLFVLYGLFTVFYRRKDLRTASFWGGGFAGVAIFGIWLLRNALVFGNPLQSDYTDELNPDYMAQFIGNMVFYLNPIHNLLPVLLPFTAYGIFKYRQSHAFLLWACAAVFALTAIWTTLSMRFAFPVFPVLLAFSVAGIFAVHERLPGKMRLRFTSILSVLIVTVHVSAVCLYSLGSCNALFDSAFGWLPKDLHLSQEGQYSWLHAADFVKEHIEKGEKIYVYDPAHAVVYHDYFGEEVTVTNDVKQCAEYRIVSRLSSEDEENIAYETDVHPKRYVLHRECDQVF